MAVGTQEKNAGGTEAELSEAMGVGMLRGGTLAVKPVRHAFAAPAARYPSRTADHTGFPQARSIRER
jgi:hypothetical protein